MVQRIYLAVLLSAAADFMLLYGVDRNCKQPAPLIRLMIASLLSGGYTCLCLVSGLSFLGSSFWRILVLTAMGLVAYDLNIKKTLQFLLLELALYGITAQWEQPGVWNFLLGAVLVVVLMFLSMGNHNGERFSKVQIHSEGEIYEFSALCDNGNMLKDPITGADVLIVSAQLADKMIGLSADQLKDPLKCIVEHNGLRLIPFHTVGGSGLLVAKRFDRVCVDGMTSSRIVAFSPTLIGKGKQFCALTGGNP